MMIDLFTLENTATFLNSNFTSSLSGALAGALAGALIAHRIADRAKQRELLLQEIRSTNAAIVVAFTICNAALALKKQHTKDIYDKFNTKKKEFKEFFSCLAQGQKPATIPFEYEADFRTLEMPIMPIDILRTQLYEKISVSGRPLAVVAALSGSIASLGEVIQTRNTLIARIRELGKVGQYDLAAFYFGMAYGEGQISTEFSDTIEALYNKNDDLIFFSELLGNDLMDHGNRLMEKYKKFSVGDKEKVHRIDYTDARNKGLMPDPADYKDWMKGFPDET